MLRNFMRHRRAVRGFMLILWFAVACVLAVAQQKLVEEIVIHGNRRIPADTIRARIFTHAGDAYDDADLQRGFSSLWNTGYFDDLRFEREDSPKGYRLHVYVKEKPTIRTIEYKNLNSVSNSDVLDRFKERKLGLSVESQFDPGKVKRAEVLIKELLAEHGHQFATIKTEVRQIPPAAVGISFAINEGPKVKVGKIVFEGNTKVPNRTLRAAMKNTKPIGIPKSIFLENLFARTYDSSKLEEDAERVRDALQQRGYFKAIVGEPKKTMKDTAGRNWLWPFHSHNGKSVDLTLPIEEGNQYHLGSITFKNNKAVSNVKALRGLFPMNDGDIINTEKIRKGIKNLESAYAELGYIKFTSVPSTIIDDAKKTVSLEIDVDENKAFSVRRIEFSGNTTTRDKVIRRELALEEGNVYNNRLWELSTLRINQLQYFEAIKADQDTEKRIDEPTGNVDLTLKVKEKGKNSIGLNGGVSGLAGAFIGINYTTNNFLGRGETVSISASTGSTQKLVNLGYTQPYLFDRPLQFGVNVYASKYNYDQAKQVSIQSNTQLNLSQNVLDTLQNYTQSSAGFTVSASYPIRRSFKRVGISYTLDRSTIKAFSTASLNLFEFIAFRNISGPNALQGVITSRIQPQFLVNKIDNPQRPHTGYSFVASMDIAGLGGNVAYLRPVVEFKQFKPVRGGSHTFGYRIQGAYVTGYRGLNAPPADRFYVGGENDLRGFDIRTLSPYILIPDVFQYPLTNPDGSTVPKDPTNPRQGAYSVPIPIYRLSTPGGDVSIINNVEYVIPIAGPVSFAIFNDLGFTMAVRQSELSITDTQLNILNTTAFGCPAQDALLNCINSVKVNPAYTKPLVPIAGTNYVPRMSSGVELRVVLPVVNAPVRIYYAYNTLRLNTIANITNKITRDMFPAGGAGDYSFAQAQAAFSSNYRLREPRKTFKFTVATTF